jgi:hypothetical protein
MNFFLELDKYSPDLISSSITGLAFGIKPLFLATNIMPNVPRAGILRSDIRGPSFAHG